ncbi:hypothetical protein H5410_026700 [Solanum commersonii]|uniref:Uncharacterized protein n=1 Tax=Solanum commersonii TaxID=4109 RepID=A0A9J5YZL2_SOLCO|nr:hypothetical protein H5410_026700 [Solanum commersonii]
MAVYKKICTSISITFTNFIKCYEFYGKSCMCKIQPMRERHLAQKMEIPTAEATASGDGGVVLLF